jgi:hypothetical protein
MQKIVAPDNYYSVSPYYYGMLWNRETQNPPVHNQPGISKPKDDDDNPAEHNFYQEMYQ